jgi:hypothetical protein
MHAYLIRSHEVQITIQTVITAQWKIIFLQKKTVAQVIKKIRVIPRMRWPPAVFAGLHVGSYPEQTNLVHILIPQIILNVIIQFLGNCV